MIENTSDPFVVIIEKSVGNESPADDYVIYKSTITNITWKISGRCNCCGLCEVGSTSNILWNENKKIGEENACTDLDFPNRYDNPATPETPIDAIRQRNSMLNQGRTDVLETAECTLTGEYL